MFVEHRGNFYFLPSSPKPLRPLGGGQIYPVRFMNLYLKMLFLEKLSRLLNKIIIDFIAFNARQSIFLALQMLGNSSEFDASADSKIENAFDVVSFQDFSKKLDFFWFGASFELGINFLLPTDILKIRKFFDGITDIWESVDEW